MKAFVKLKEKIWRMDLVLVDELVKKNNGLRHLLIRQQQFDWTKNAEREWKQNIL